VNRLDITVCDLPTARNLLRDRRAFPFVVSISGPGRPLPEQLAAGGRKILRLEFLDSEDPIEPGAPERHHVEQLISFARNLPENPGILVHCDAGISRSTAAALILHYLCLGNPVDAANALLQNQPNALPNRLFVHYADELLGSHLQEVCEKFHRLR